LIPLPVNVNALRALVAPTLLLKTISADPALTVKLFAPLIVGPNDTEEFVVVIVVFALSVRDVPTYVCEFVVVIDPAVVIAEPFTVKAESAVLEPILEPRLTVPEALAAIATSDLDPDPFKDPANVISPPAC
jgi:hypothetical protein